MTGLEIRPHQGPLQEPTKRRLASRLPSRRGGRLRHIGCWAVLLLGLPFPAAMAQDGVSVKAVDLRAAVALDNLAAELAVKRVVFVGEIHDRYDHHLNQLEIIKRLHALNPAFALGVEYFQRPFQQQVDDYISGRIEEEEFLRSTEYYKRWGYDYRLYAPIFRYAREQRIPVRALNVPREATSALGKSGLAGLTQEQRAKLPQDIQPADEGYRKRLREVFESHPGSTDFDRFVEAQLVWDEGMAESAAAYLNENQNHRLVVLAGSGHIAFGSGIPSRVERRTKAPYAIVLSSGEQAEPGMADYLLLSEKQDLPPAGVLGIRMEDKAGECRISSLSPGGAGAKAGLRKGDAILGIDSEAIHAIFNVRLALWKKKPGDRVSVRVLRRGFFRKSEREYEVELEASTPR